MPEHLVVHRKRALESFRSILEFLSRPDALFRFVQLENKFEINLEKNVPDNPYHKNLVLVFEPTLTSGGAKFSLRSDGRFTITIFVPYRNIKEMWAKEFPRYVREWFLNRRSSYVHEFIHYLDIRDQQLDKIVAPDASDNKKYYNHPWELKAFTQQALSDIEDAVEIKLLNKWKLWVKEFGITKDQFVVNAIRKYVNPEFFRYLTPDNKKSVENELGNLYQDLLSALKEKPSAEVTEDNVMKRILNPPLSPNLTLKMAYQDQQDQEEANKDMSKKAIMQYVSELVRKTVNEVLENEKSNTSKGKTWKDINKLAKTDNWLPEDEPDQKEASKKSRKLVDLFKHLDNLGGQNMPFGESSTFGSDSFQGSAYGFGGKNQLTDPTDHMPPEEEDTDQMQLPSARSRGGLNNPTNGPDQIELGSKNLTDDDEGLNLYTSLTELNSDINERTESDALYRDLFGMAIDPDVNDKNFDPEPPAPEEFGADHHVGGMGKLVAPHRFIPAKTDTTNPAIDIAKKRLAESLHQRSRLRKLGLKL